jgi:hypothetical protein
VTASGDDMHPSFLCEVLHGRGDPLIHQGSRKMVPRSEPAHGTNAWPMRDLTALTEIGVVHPP